MTEFQGARVLITGGASGLGRGLAEKIAGAGAHVVLWDLDGPGLDDLCGVLEARGHRVSAYRCDVSRRDQVYATAARVQEEHGFVDVLINNAGVVTGKPILAAADEEIERSFAVNALAHFWTVRAFLPAMIERNAGHIVTVASAAGLAGAPKLTDYAASKFAAVGFDESLRLELDDAGVDVRTTVVCPFFVNTGMFAGVKTRFPRLLPILDPDEVTDRIVEAVRRDRRRVIMPRFVYVTPPLRALPVAWFDRLLRFFGVTRTMDDFRGRAGRA